MIVTFKLKQTKLTLFIYFNDTNNIKNIYNLNSYFFLNDTTTIIIIEELF